jgi:hypothetical protein
MSDPVMNLPVPYIESDGSVNEISIVRYEFREWISIRNAGASIVVANATHARALAHALTVAANLLDANPEK